MKLPQAAPDVMLATDGHLYVNAASVPLAARGGRRVIRCIALTPAEEAELLRRIGALTGELLVKLAVAYSGRLGHPIRSSRPPVPGQPATRSGAPGRDRSEATRSLGPAGPTCQSEGTLG
jgi:hypothetical protein